jgi:hypothetical protein
VLELGKPSLQLVDPDGISVELVAPAPAPLSRGSAPAEVRVEDEPPTSDGAVCTVAPSATASAT